MYVKELHRSPVFLFFLLIMVMLSPGFLPGSVFCETIRIGGVGGALGTIRTLAAEFRKTHPKDTITIMPSLGSGGGIKALLAGAVQISLSARPLTEEEKKKGAVQRECAKTPFVFAMRAPAGTWDFTLERLADLYAGRVKTWPEGIPVRVVLRPAGDSDSAMLRNMSPAMDAAVRFALSQPGMIFAVTDQDSADSIEEVPGAIGTSTLAQIISEKRKIKPLSIGEVRPDLHSLQNGTYPYFKPLYIITSKESSSELAGRFVEFVFSRKGRRILEKSGYLPTGS